MNSCCLFHPGVILFALIFTPEQGGACHAIARTQFQTLSTVKQQQQPTIRILSKTTALAAVWRRQTKSQCDGQTWLSTSHNWQAEAPSSRLACGLAYDALSWLVIDVERPSSQWASSTILRQAKLSFLRKVHGDKPGSKPVSILLWFASSSCLELVPWLSSVTDYNL